MILLAFEPETFSADQVARIRDAAPDGFRVGLTRDREEIRAIIDDIEIAAGWFPADLLPEASSLRWYQQWTAGADWLLRHPEAEEADFVLTNTSGIHAIPASEHIFALLLAFARNLPQAVRAQEHRQWIPIRQQKQLSELAHKTLLLVGVGAIGERTAQIARALGLDVLGVRRDPTVGSPGVDTMYGPNQLGDVLPLADFVVVTVPLTEETRGMIGEEELKVIKDTAIIVNVGRGGTIDENALLRALEEGWIAGAGLDVFQTEPLPEDSPLWELDNAIITSHYAGVTPRYHERALGVFLDNLKRYAADEPLLNVVDKDLGY